MIILYINSIISAIQSFILSNFYFLTITYIMNYHNIFIFIISISIMIVILYNYYLNLYLFIYFVQPICFHSFIYLTYLIN